MQRSIILFTLMYLFIPVYTNAHGYWVEAEGSHKVKEPFTIKLYFGEYATGEKLSGSFLDRMKEIKVFVKIAGGQQQAVQMKQLEDYWVGTYTPQVEGSYEITGINEEREVQDWKRHNLGIVRPVQYLKTIYQVGDKITQQSSQLFIDTEVTLVSPGIYRIKTYKNSSAYTESTILITGPDGGEIKLNADKNGIAEFTAPKPGLFLVDIEWIDKTPGQFKQKAYETVRYKMDFSLYN